MEGQQGNGEFFSDIQIDGAIIRSHSQLNPDYSLVKLEDGRFLLKEEKLELINIDLTSGFLTSEMQEYCLNVVDYLSHIVDLEAELGVDLTRHYNRIARPILYMYSLSKSGGKAANAVKSHYQIGAQYNVDRRTEEDEKNGNIISNFFGSMPKPDVRLVGDHSVIK